jgi:cysteinyl-tRNA synthetase
MPLYIYNTLTKRKEPFKPIKDGEVGMYVCGVTVYDLCHIGHARAAIVFDVIYRYLKYCGYKVTYVRNFTDVDDKIIKRANDEGVLSEVIAERYIKEFYADMNALGVEMPTYEPKATGHIPEMIEMIKGLIDKGYAYQSDGDVFYSVRKFNGYGNLSGKNMDELMAGARVEIDEKKKDPLDFALWKASKPGEPWWESPWGRGRPGWHIECSAMGQKYLGQCFDIHGGGKDLVFPHHENEIAQSYGATGHPPVRYWIHNGFVNINKEKMSKSLGNFFTIKEILKKFNPEVIRFFLLSSHYRSPIDFSDQNLNEAKINLDRFYDLFLFAESKIQDSRFKIQDLQLIQKFEEAMNDDFNTAQVIGYMNTELHKLNSMRSLIGKGEIKSIVALKKIGEVLGLFNQNPAEYFEKEKSTGLATISISEDEIKRLIDERGRARKERRWADADRIRSELGQKGIILEDTPEGTKWKVKG